MASSVGPGECSQTPEASRCQMLEAQPWSLCRLIHAKDNTVVRGKLRVGKIRGDWQVKASA